MQERQKRKSAKHSIILWIQAKISRSTGNILHFRIWCPARYKFRFWCQLWNIFYKCRLQLWSAKVNECCKTVTNLFLLSILSNLCVQRAGAEHFNILFMIHSSVPCGKTEVRFSALHFPVRPGVPTKPCSLENHSPVWYNRNKCELKSGKEGCKRGISNGTGFTRNRKGPGRPLLGSTNTEELP